MNFFNYADIENKFEKDKKIEKGKRLSFFNQLYLIKNSIFENQHEKLLRNSQMIALTSIMSEINISIINSVFFGILAFQFRRIFFARYNIFIKGFYNNLALDLIVPCSILNYFMITKYPYFGDKFLKNMIDYEEGLEIEMRKENEFAKLKYKDSYEKKFYTNSQFWH